MIIQHGEGRAYCLALTDKSFDKIKKDRNLLLNKDILIELLQEDGDNLHIVRLDGMADPHIIIRYVRELKRRFKSVTWYNRDMSKLIGG